MEAYNSRPSLLLEVPLAAAGVPAVASLPPKEPNKGTSSADKRWSDMYQRLLKYKREHGDCQVPNRYEQDPKLGAWVSTQRRHYRVAKNQNVESESLTPERIRQLEEAGFGWTGVNPRNLHWDVRYQELLQFKQRFGHVNVPINWSENVKLANWTSTQRQEYKNKLKGIKKSRLDDRRILLLNEVAFAWELQRGGRKRLLTATAAASDEAAADSDDEEEEEEERPKKVARTEDYQAPKDCQETIEAALGVASLANQPPQQQPQPVHTERSDLSRGEGLGGVTATNQASSILNHILTTNPHPPLPSALNPIPSALTPFASAAAVGTITAPPRAPAPDLVSLALRLQQTESTTQALGWPGERAASVVHHRPNALEELTLMQQIQAQQLGNRAVAAQQALRDRPVTDLDALCAQILLQRRQQQQREQQQLQQLLLSQMFQQQSVAVVPVSNNGQLLQSLLDGGTMAAAHSSSLLNTPFLLANSHLLNTTVMQGAASAPSASAAALVGTPTPDARPGEDLDQKPPARGP